METAQNDKDHAAINYYVTERSHSLLLKSIEHGHRFCMHPYQWNSASNRCERTTSKTRLFVWHVNALAMISYYIFVVFRFVQTTLDETSSARETVLGFFGLAFFSFPTTFQLTYLLYGSEIPGFISQSLTILKGNLWESLVSWPNF